MGMTGAGGAGLIARVAVKAVNAAINSKLKANTKNVASALSQNTKGLEEYNFGTQFPINNITNVKKIRSNVVKYTATIKYEKKGK